MRIAQVAPLFESVPPKLYGGTERVVFNLTEALIDEGHDVTLFASGDSETSARLIAGAPRGLRLDGCREVIAPHLLMFEKVRSMADDFDIIHFHNEYMHFPLARAIQTPTVSTLHGRLDLPEYRELFKHFSDLPLVSISNRQAQPLPNMNWVGCVQHGMQKDLIPFARRESRGSHGYLAFLGRLSPEKGFADAVEIARRSGRRLKVAAKVEPSEYLSSVKHLLDEPHVEYIGEIGDRDKASFLGGAEALILPICWPEPFGLVMIESLAAGTPVVAYGAGAVPEIIDSGRTGFIVEDVAGAVAAIERIDEIDRFFCREVFEARFTRERMARDYLRLYRSLTETARLHDVAMAAVWRMN